VRDVGQRTASGAVRLLRYRFDTIHQVSRHFHVATGRVVLFYPGLLTLRPGEPVLLDVTFISSEQHCPVRGLVIGKEGGTQYVGWWLEFAAHGLVGSLQSATANPKRRQRRFPADVVVNIDRQEGMPVVGKLADVGNGGGRIVGVTVRAAVGETVRLSMFSDEPDSPVLAARVAWARGSELGVEFIKRSSAERTAIVALVDEVRQKLAAAYEVAHPSFCLCTDGKAVVEPPLPRSTHRQTGSH
jgi:hypothetical protein